MTLDEMVALQHQILRLKEQIRARDRVISQSLHDAVFAGSIRPNCTVILAADDKE